MVTLTGMWGWEEEEIEFGIEEVSFLIDIGC